MHTKKCVETSLAVIDEYDSDYIIAKKCSITTVLRPRQIPITFMKCLCATQKTVAMLIDCHYRYRWFMSERVLFKTNTNFNFDSFNPEDVCLFSRQELT